MLGASPAQARPGQIAFSRDGTLFFQCIGNGVDVYSYPAMEKEAMATLEGHTGPAIGLALDQSGRCGLEVLGLDLDTHPMSKPKSVLGLALDQSGRCGLACPVRHATRCTAEPCYSCAESSGHILC